MPLFRSGKPYRDLSADGTFSHAGPTTTLVWSSADEDGEWDPASSLSTTIVSRAGLYLVTLSAARGARATSAVWSVIIDVSGTRVARTDSDASAAARAASCAWLGQLDVGDAVTGVGLNMGGATLDAAGSRMGLARIGPIRWT